MSLWDDDIVFELRGFPFPIMTDIYLGMVTCLYYCCALPAAALVVGSAPLLISSQALLNDDIN